MYTSFSFPYRDMLMSVLKYNLPSHSQDHKPHHQPLLDWLWLYAIPSQFTAPFSPADPWAHLRGDHYKND